MDRQANVIALDTNLLVYAHRAAVLEHRAARKAIEKALNDPRGCGVSLPCIAEFWSIVTHPLARGGASKPVQASKFIASLQQAEMRLWMPGEGFADRLIEAAVDLSLGGARIFDLQIALIAIENGAEEIWSHDRNFLKLKGLRVHDPLP
jgi:predicted nucleic acid-binding protein